MGQETFPASSFTSCTSGGVIRVAVVKGEIAFEEVNGTTPVLNTFCSFELDKLSCSCGGVLVTMKQYMICVYS